MLTSGSFSFSFQIFILHLNSSGVFIDVGATVESGDGEGFKENI